MFLEEPGCKSRGGYPNGLPDSLYPRYERFLEDNVSVIAEDPSNDNLICGVMVSTIVKKSAGDVPKPTYDEMLKELPETHAMINLVCDDSIHPSDFFQKFPQCQKIVDLFALGVHQDYKRRGIASALVQKSIEASKSQGCDGALIIATSKYTNNIAKKLDMNLYRTVYWRDYFGWFPEEKMPCPEVNSYYMFY